MLRSLSPGGTRCTRFSISTMLGLVETPWRIDIYSGSRKIALNPFFSTLMTHLILGFTASLKGIPHTTGFRVEYGNRQGRLFANGKEVALNPFVRSVFSDLMTLLLTRIHTLEDNAAVRIRLYRTESLPKEDK